MLGTPPNVFALAIDPATPATVYAGTWGSGAFKSHEAGGNLGSGSTLGLDQPET